jgi:hypothetical protein
MPITHEGGLTGNERGKKSRLKKADTFFNHVSQQFRIWHQAF